MGIIQEDLVKTAIDIDIDKSLICVNDQIEKVMTNRDELLKQEVSMSEDLFRNKGFISHERWSKTINIHARVLSFSKQLVSCECIIDRENGIFETRTFPRDMFSHLNGLKEKFPIVINIKKRPGSSRIDIYDGHRLIDNSLFDLEEGWKGLENSGLDKPINFND